MRFTAVLIFFIFSTIISPNQLIAQFKIRGKVSDATNQEPLSFVSIGIPKTQFGTISNEDGSFELSIPDLDAPLIFSYVGYQQLRVRTKSLVDGQSELEVFLIPSSQPLESVVITAKKIKAKQWKLGNPYGSSSIVLSDSVYSGAEIALRMSLKKQETSYFVKEVRFKVRDNTLDEVKARPRFYEVDKKTGQPGNEITLADQVVRSKIQNGWVQITIGDVLEVTDDFFLSIEWLFDKDDRKAISRSYHDFKTYHAGLIQTKYAFVNGKRVPYEDFGGNLKVGWSISCSTEPNVSSRHSAYIRYNSFGSWNLSTAVPVLQAVVSNRLNVTSTQDLEPPSADLSQPFDNSYFRKIGYDLETRTENASMSTEAPPQIRYLTNPVVDVSTKYDNGRILINAVNESTMPQTLKVKLGEVHNLTLGEPEIIRRVDPGYNSVATIRITDPREPYHYSLNVKSEAVKTDMASEDSLRLFIDSTSKYSLLKNRVEIIGQKGDTVSSEFEGSWITHPMMNQPSVQIGQKDNFCLLTDDGFLIVYEGDFKPIETDWKIGRVSAGMPFATLVDDSYQLNVYRIKEDNLLETATVKWLTK